MYQNDLLYIGREKDKESINLNFKIRIQVMILRIQEIEAFYVKKDK